ncbi:MAG: ArnT family glycosyltransferase [Candidatus Aminicenantia bacterium]
MPKFDKETKKTKFNIIFYFLLFLFSLSAFLVGFVNLDGWLINDDEGVYLYSAWRISLGEIPYQDFFLSQTPLSFYLTGFLFKLFTPSVSLARGICYLLFLITAFFIYLISRKIFHLNKFLSLMSGVIFIFTKNINLLGKTFMPDCFMIFFGGIATYCVLKAEIESKNRRKILYLFLFGFFCGFSALSKLSGILLLPGYYLFLLFSLVLQKEHLKNILLKAIYSFLGFFISFGAFYSIMSIFIPSIYYGTLGFHLSKQKIAFNLFLIIINFFERIGKFIGNHNYGVIPIALISLTYGFIKKDKNKILMFCLIFPFFILAFIPMDFYVRYFAFTLIGLTVFFSDSLKIISEHRKIFRFSLPLIIILLIISLAPTFNLKRILKYDQGTRNLVRYIQKHSQPDDYLFSDYAGINFYSKRPCPPQLNDVSLAMTKSGQIISQDIIDQCDSYQVKIILVDIGGSAHHLKNLKDYSKFKDYLRKKYKYQGTIQREFQLFEIYLRKSIY